MLSTPSAYYASNHIFIDYMASDQQYGQYYQPIFTLHGTLFLEPNLGWVALRALVNVFYFSSALV